MFILYVISIIERRVGDSFEKCRMKEFNLIYKECKGGF